MIFGDYIQSLPNERFEVQNRIKKECNVTSQTINRWIHGVIRPTAENRKKIALLLERDEIELFPVKKD